MLDGKKDFLDTEDFAPATLMELLKLAVRMKQNKKKYARALQGQKLAMIFEKSSTRTRVSFETGIYEMGGMGLFLSSRDIQIGRGEPIADTAQVLSRYCDGIMIRTFGQDTVEELARKATIPVINGLTDKLHPCQAMADFQTILEEKGGIAGVKIAFIGDGNNVAQSLGLLASRLGADFHIACPEGYDMEPKLVEQMKLNAALSGSKLLFTRKPEEAAAGADVLYTDVWTSMGQEEESKKRFEAFQGFQINARVAAAARKDYIFLHCLPAHRGEEVTTEVIDGPNSRIFDEAENRLHAQKAVMYRLMAR